MTADGVCPLWGTDALITHSGRELVVRSERTGGRYTLLWPLAQGLDAENLPNRARAQLTTWLVNRRRQGDELPELTREIIKEAQDGRLPSMLPTKKADFVLQRIAQEVPNVGADLDWPEFASRPAVAAHCEAEHTHEVRILLDYLEDLKYASVSGRSLKLTAQGYQRIAELELSGVDSMQIFVAMWFDDSINRLYDDAIKIAIEQAGYTPYRVDIPPRGDKSTYEMKVCDRIEVEIRRSRMLVADFTHGKAGARGGVYFEAGLARGLGIPVIWTCREDMFDELHFDTRQYPHIGWTETKFDQFQQALKDRIELLAESA